MDLRRIGWNTKRHAGRLTLARVAEIEMNLVSEDDSPGNLLIFFIAISANLALRLPHDSLDYSPYYLGHSIMSHGQQSLCLYCPIWKKARFVPAAARQTFI